MSRIDAQNILVSFGSDNIKYIIIIVSILFMECILAGEA